MSTCWMIRNTKGLFSTGGSNPGWSEDGKKWNSRQAARQHIAAKLDPYIAAKLDPFGRGAARNKIQFYKDCDLVCFEMKAIEEIRIGDLYK